MNAFDQSYGYFQQLERAGKWSIPWWSARFYAQLAHRYAPAAYPRRALDVGCGLGMLLAQLTPDFVTYGLDISAFALAVARRRAPHAHLVLGDAGSLAAFPGNYFHAVIAKHVLEHLPEPEEALGQCARLLVPKGVLIFGTPNTRSLLRPLKGKQWIGVRDPTHVAVLPPKVWLTLTAQAG
ncbi:MAG: class I SAM-dependent methyltransferase, partial [Thermoanaerobaculum sp.]|nr:class I SAM-dependent methyltransferase [Thermoanaerobaculum sp.]